MDKPEVGALLASLLISIKQFSIITYLSSYYNRFMKGDAKGRAGGVAAIKEPSGAGPPAGCVEIAFVVTHRK